MLGRTDGCLWEREGTRTENIIITADESEAVMVCGLPHIFASYWAFPSADISAAMTPLANQLQSEIGF